jgi:uncharacterized membrane protein (UPF0127 family)
MVITLIFNGQPLHCIVLDSQRKREKGLMFVKRLPPNTGALFLFDRLDYHPFWMKNTFVPLDIIFLSETGRVVEVVQGQPGSTTLIGGKVKSKYAVEANRGFVENVTVGAFVQLK